MLYLTFAFYTYHEKVFLSSTIFFQAIFFFNIANLKKFMAVLGLHCYSGFLYLVTVSQGYSSLCCAGFSLRWPLLLWSIGSRLSGFRNCGTWALGALWHVGSLRTRNRNHVSWIGRCILYHWATREVSAEQCLWFPSILIIVSCVCVYESPEII